MGLKLAKCNGIQHITRLHQMLRKWTIRALFSRSTSSPPSDVPKGHVAVCVGTNHRRYVVHVMHINHPVFRDLLERAAEDYGFGSVGPILIPCDESDFEQILHCISSSSSNFGESRNSSCCCHVLIQRASQSEALPLLGGSGCSCSP